MSGDWLFHGLVTQTLQVTLLAGLVFGLTKLFAKDRPHLAHALWALVLLKCLTPPIIASPTSVFSWLPDRYSASSSKMNVSAAANAPSPDSSDRMEGLATVVVRVLREDSTHAIANSASSSSPSAARADVDGRWLIRTAIFLWLSVATMVLAANGFRLWIFLRRVKKATLPTSQSLSQLSERVSKRIGLRRSVRVLTVDAAFGPAVVGLIWPTILLPKVIVEGKSDTELEPLLAHELVHVRRGDLLWAMLQGISVSLWWFNPLIWVADRLLTREAERSCDEETIAGLGCSPAVYARSLLDVMERKHQLRAAPSLPGVRPVDITAKRLERIMRLGHGCYRQRPWWVVAVWLIGCAMVLPGGAWLTAQENPEQKPSVFKEASFSSENRQQSAKQPDKQPDKQPIAPAHQREVFSSPVAKDPTTSKQIEEMTFQFEHVLELADLLERLCKERKLEKPEAEKELIRLLTPLAAPESEEVANATAQSPELSLEDATARAIKNARQMSAGIAIRVAGNQLHVLATEGKRKQIEQRLAHFRQFGFASIVTELDFYEVPRRLTEKELEAISDKFASDDRTATTERIETNSRATVTSDLGSTGTLVMASQPGAIVLDDAEIAKFEKWLAEDSNRDVLHVSSPRVISLSGQLATVEIGNTRDFTVSHKLVKTKDREPTVGPVTQRVMVGSRYEIRTTLVQKDDTQQIKLHAKFHHTEVERVDKSKQKLEGIDQELNVERPIVQGQLWETSVEFGVDQALVVMKTSENKTSITLVRCTLLAGPLVKVPRANLGETAPIAYVTVSDELQSDLEVALLKEKLEQLGIEDYRIEEGRIQVNFAEDWKAATNAFQELRSKRTSMNLGVATFVTLGVQQLLQSEQPTQKAVDAATFTDGETAYQPIQMFGPFTRAQGVPVLGQVPYVNRLFKGSVKLDVPSDDEILQAIEEDASQKGLALKDVAKGQLKMTATKIKEFSDAARFVPLVGDAILHHSHYKCEFQDAATQELKHTAYIDYCQFQVAIGSEK